MNRTSSTTEPLFSAAEGLVRRRVTNGSPYLTLNDSLEVRTFQYSQAFLKKALYYRDLQESSGVKSVRGLSEITGEDWSYIARVLKTLELPELIQTFLNQNQDPAIIKHFHLRRLLELARLPQDAQIQRSLFLSNRNGALELSIFPFFLFGFSLLHKR